MSVDVSVIVPVYNTERFLARCVESIIRAATECAIEVILVNDGSSDGSGVLCDSLGAMHSFVTVVHQANKGQSAARNVGLRIARGEYVLFVDSDDWIAERSIDRLYRAAKESRCDIVHGEMCGWGRVSDAAISDFGHATPVAGLRCSGLRYLIDAVQGRCYDIVPVLKLVRLSYLRRRQIWFAEGLCYEDHLYNLQLFDDDDSTVVRLPLPFYFYEVNMASTTNTFSARKLADICVILSMMVEHVGRRNAFRGVDERDALDAVLAISYYHVSSVYARVAVADRMQVVEKWLPELPLKVALAGLQIGKRLGAQNLLFWVSPELMGFVHSMLFKWKIIRR